MNALLDAVGSLYASALDPDGWTAALDGIVTLVGGGHAILVAGDPGGATPFVATARLASDHRALFLAPESMPLFAPFLASKPAAGTAVLRQQIMDDAAFERSAVYNEIIRPADGFHSINAMGRGPAPFALSLCRGRRSGMFDGIQAGIIERLLPHVAMALEVRRRVDGGGHVDASLTRLLDRIGQAVLVTDALGQPCFANRRGGDLLAEEDGLFLGPDGLAGAGPLATRDLRRAILAATADDAAASIRVRLPRATRPPLLVSVMPLRRLGTTIPGVPGPSAALFISEPDVPGPVDREALAETYQLTRRECDVALLLAEGLSLPEIAKRLTLGVGAVRQYLNRVYDKTGRHSQASLVVLVRGFATAFPAD